MELVDKYRPKKLSDVLGQPEIVKSLEKSFREDSIPHALMFSGPKGTGKTTLAQIVACQLLQCGNDELKGRALDYFEINAAEARGIDTVREIQNTMQGKGWGSTKRKVFFYEEIHELSRRAQGNAQSALLVLVERPPEHVFHIASTTNPEELLPTLRDRFIRFDLKPITAKCAKQLINAVLSEERKAVGENVIDKIVDCSEGSPRLILKNLDKCLMLNNDEDRLSLIQKTEIKKDAYELVNVLLYKKMSWSQISGLINETDLSEPERLRHYILKRANTEMLKGNPRAYLIYLVFKDQWFNCQEAALTGCCWEVFNSKE
jgi:DNA polymerase-3 subunit gamma/tau